MSKDIPGAGWGTDCEAQLQYDFEDNYYLLTWDDPNCIEIRNTQQVIAALGMSLSDDDAPWSRHNDNDITVVDSTESGQATAQSITKPPTRDIKELMDWLNAEQKGAERVPSDNYICDECGYVWIRRILTKHEE